MLKILFIFPLLFVAGAVVFASLIPLLALLPVVLAVGAGLFAIVLTFAVLGLVLRLAAALVIGAGGLLFVALGFGVLFAGGAAFVAMAAALSHLIVPILLIVGLVWLIRRASQPAKVSALPPPSA